MRDVLSPFSEGIKASQTLESLDAVEVGPWTVPDLDVRYLLP